MKKASIFFLTISLACSLLSISGCGTCDHEWKEATCLEPKVCQKCQATEGEPLGHVWQDATCTQPKTCKRCGETEGDPLEHDWLDATCTQPKTCKRCSETEGDPLGHDWLDATCTEPKTCKRCGETEGDPLGHDAPNLTCTSDGVCQRCGETIPALGHDWQDATCTEPKTCTRCGETEGDPLGHTTSAGKCKRCGIDVFETVTGQGDDVVSDITLDADKIYRVHFTHSGSRNFIVKSYDSKNDKDLLINDIGNYDGRVLINGKSPFAFEIKADGEWTYTIESVELTAEKSFSGRGDDVTGLASITSGAWVFTHDGDRNFIVKVYTANGRDLLINEIGNYNGKVMVLIPEGSPAMFEIIADGNWTIEKSQ